MTIALVADSTIDLPPGWAEKYNLNIVPINIQFGTKTFQDNVTITRPEFYKIIEETGVLPQTSQPSVGEFVELYRRLAQTADEIISLHITSKLSGTHQSAVLAAQEVADTVTVHVIDSKAGSAAMLWMLLEARDLIAQNVPGAEIVNRLKARRQEVSVFFAIDTLKFAEMSGRVNRLTSIVSTLLNIKPIIGLENGLLSAREKARSSKSALRRIVALTREQIGDAPVDIGVVHAEALDKGEVLLALAKESLNVKDSFLTDVTLALAVHFGPGTVGLVTYPAREQPSH